MSVASPYTFKDESLVNALQDLAVRFIINCPSEDLNSSERLFFQLEEAQWFYEDFVRVENPSLPSMRLKTFVEKLFNACPILSAYSKDMYADLAKFQSYKSVIPVRGAIILNKKMTKALMVKGWKQGASWGFPRGKINKDEENAPCAVREVYEEIGFDISPYMNEDDYIEVTIRQKNIRLYIVRGVPGNTVFNPQTRKEISKIQWHDVSQLPAFNRQGNNSKWDYFLVAPFMPGLQKYIKKSKGVASSLSKTESTALKSLLGVGGDGAAQKSVDDNDATAAELLSLIKGAENSSEEQKTDKKVLLDLLTQNSASSHDNANKKDLAPTDMEQAREILSLLRTEMSDYNQLQQLTSQSQLPPPGYPPIMPPMGNYPIPPPPPFFGMAPPPPPPPPPPQFGGGYPPPPLPPFAFLGGMPPPPPPPGWAPPPPAPPPPPPSAPVVEPEPKITNADDTRESLINYNAPPPPPPPPNPVLLSLLNKRKGGGKSAENDREDKYESYRSKLRNKNISLSDIVDDENKGLMSLLSTNKKPERAKPVQNDSNNRLMDMLNNNQPERVKSPSEDLMSMLNINKQPEPQPAAPPVAELNRVKSPSEDLMSMLNKPKQEPERVKSPSEDLMSMLNKPKQEPVQVQEQELERVKSPSEDLMSMLNKPSAEPKREVRTPSQDLMSMLNKPPAEPQQNHQQLEKPSTPSQDLMSMLNKTPAEPKVVERAETKSPSADLMGLLGIGGDAKPVSHTPQEPDVTISGSEKEFKTSTPAESTKADSEVSSKKSKKKKGPTKQQRFLQDFINGVI